MKQTEDKIHVQWHRFDRAVNMALTADFALARDTLKKIATASQGLDPLDRCLSDFEQFVIASVMLWRALIAGEVSEMGDWIQWSLTDAPEDFFVHELILARVEVFTAMPMILGWPKFRQIMVAFFTGLYEYGRRRTALKEICLGLLPIAWPTFEGRLHRPPNQITPEDLGLGCVILCWATKEAPDVAKCMAIKFEKFATERRLSKWQRYLFSLTLSTTAGRFSVHGSRYWANHALTKLLRYASETDKTQLLCTVMRTDEQGPADAERVLAQMRTARTERVQGISAVAIARSAAQTVEYVTPFFVRTLSMGRGDLLLRGLQTWYCQESPTDKLDASKVLFLMPFGETGSSALCGGQLFELTRETQQPLEGISRAMSSFLGTYTTVAGANNNDLPIPERPGLPRELQKGLAVALRDAYCPKGLDIPGNPTSQLIMPTEGHPIQATQLVNWNRTWPIASSLTRPRPDRIPLTVLIWGVDTITAEMELDMVERAFKNAGARVERRAPSTCTPKEFLRYYQNDEYDVVWIASHGEYDHWKPHDVRLQIASDGSAVDLNDLWGHAPNCERRRLLVLNVCDGARFAEPGLLPRVGLAPGLSASFQATISHLWPVRPYPSAAFGAYLAYFLAQNEGYFQAYIMTLQALQKKTRDLALDLERLYGDTFDLTQRLVGREDDFDTIEVWGSAAFFQ